MQCGCKQAAQQLPQLSLLVYRQLMCRVFECFKGDSCVAGLVLEGMLCAHAYVVGMWNYVVCCVWLCRLVLVGQ
jgi:hypothetical protein